MTKGLLLGGRKKAQMRRPEPRSWTTKKERAFLTSLAETCNVKLSAKRAGVSINCVYQRRNKNASFRASWDRALAASYVLLEMMMLERALHGVEKKVIRANGTTTTMREYSDRTALALLRMHRESAAIANQNVDEGEWEEARDRSVARLQRIRERDEAVETKASIDLPGLVRWGLRRR